MASSQAGPPPAALERRLLSDIAEIQQDPYRNVHLHFDDANIRKACLILTPEHRDPLHLTIEFGNDYPLYAPSVTMQSRIEHPNVYNNYICASMLNSDEGWTPAYTLQGIVIQLLSFFCSDSIEQDYGNATVYLRTYRHQRGDFRRPHGLQQKSESYKCHLCGFGPDWMPSESDEMEIDVPPASTGPISINYTTPEQQKSQLFTLPDEVVLLVFATLETRDILAFTDAVPSIKSMVYSYDFIRIRELQCFCLKKSFMEAKLGVGVSVNTISRRPIFRSEFDLLSQEAFYQHNVRRSIQGVAFDKWLPLPLSRRHWNQVKTNAVACVQGIHSHANMENRKPEDYIDVLYYFMNNIVVQFSADAEKGYHRADARSTLSHASEKAVEAYFGLYHLLLCLATEDAAIVTEANRIISSFTAGPRSKTQFPDLGHVLVAALITDCGLTEDLTFLIIREAILRNVVWMLDAKGAGHAELAYLEPSPISKYRLHYTFAASPTSYRLLMFLKLFSSAARPPNKSLVEIRDALFETHGAPPQGTSATMAQRIRQIRDINSFPGFLTAMRIKDLPSGSVFSGYLRRTITDSVAAGYSSMPMSQSQLFMIRKAKERSVEMASEVEITPALRRWYEDGEKWYNNGWKSRPSFFPVREGAGGARPGDDAARMIGRGRGTGGFRGRGRGFGRGRGG
jgi:ubiquitin-protein ligase